MQACESRVSHLILNFDGTCIILSSVVTGSLNRVNDTYRRFLQFYFLLKNWYNIKVVENKIMIIKRRNTFFSICSSCNYGKYFEEQE